MRVIPLLHFPVPPAPAITIARRHSIPPSYDLSRHGSFPLRSGFRYMFRSIRKFEVLATNKQLPELRNGKSESEEGISLRAEDGDSFDLGWLPAFPHVLVASMSNFLFGYHIGVMNGPIISIARELGFEGNSILEGLVVSIFIVGAFLGNYLCLTRRICVSAQAHTLDEVLWGRFLVGLGIGVNTVLVPIYISEVAPTKYRGTLGGLCQIGTCLGIIASLFLGIPSENDPHWWRTMLYIASLPGFFIAFGMQFAVESPRWLSKAGRLDEARVVICNLWGESEVERAVEEFQSVIRNDGSDLNSGWSVLLEEQNFRVAFIGGALFFLQQFAGINGVLYFSSLTFEDVGITNVALASLVIGITNFAVSHIIGIDDTNLKIMFRYIFSFAIGAGPVTGIIIPELSSTRARGKIMGFSLAVHWVCNFTVGLFFLDLVQTFGVAPVYSGFGAFSLVAAIFSKYFLVETKGRSLEEIEMALNPNFNGSDNPPRPWTKKAVTIVVSLRAIYRRKIAIK
uniref:Plastidic glucose transporter 1 n=1 Tax=Cucumis melo TaxID=3656 RepID=A0A9I9DK98_CUCME